MRNKFKGFTLIELMVIVTIIGILAAIAYPSYQDSVRKTRRADAQGALMQLNNAMERVFTQSNTYMPVSNAVASKPTLGAGANNIFVEQWPRDGTIKYYTLSIPDATITATTFTLLATPIAGTGQATDGRIELDHTGAKRWDADNSGGFSAAESKWNK